MSRWSMHSFFSHLFRSTIPRLVVVMLITLVALAWSSLASCDEIHDAVVAKTWERSRRCSKAIMIWLIAKTTNKAPRHCTVQRRQATRLWWNYC